MHTGKAVIQEGELSNKLSWITQQLEQMTYTSTVSPMHSGETKKSNNEPDAHSEKWEH